jgi:hypothetical protein
MWIIPVAALAGLLVFAVLTVIMYTLYNMD